VNSSPKFLAQTCRGVSALYVSIEGCLAIDVPIVRMFQSIEMQMEIGQWQMFSFLFFGSQPGGQGHSFKPAIRFLSFEETQNPTTWSSVISGPTNLIFRILQKRRI
jgi:hypothetical protein